MVHCRCRTEASIKSNVALVSHLSCKVLGEGLSSEVGVISILFTLMGDGALTCGMSDVTLPTTNVDLSVLGVAMFGVVLSVVYSCWHNSSNLLAASLTPDWDSESTFTVPVLDITYVGFQQIWFAG